jgi:hypothetical protein
MILWRAAALEAWCVLEHYAARQIPSDPSPIFQGGKGALWIADQADADTVRRAIAGTRAYYLHTPDRRAGEQIIRQLMRVERGLRAAGFGVALYGPTDYAMQTGRALRFFEDEEATR